MFKRFIAKPSRYHLAIWVVVALGILAANLSAAKSATPLPRCPHGAFFG